MMKCKLAVCIATIGTLFAFNAWAACYPLTVNTNMVGSLQFTKIKAGDNFTKLAQKYDVGYDQIQAANPTLDSEKPLLNAAVIIPSEFILPRASRSGIVVNLAQMRLFYYPKGKHQVCTFPVGIGKQDWQTPQGDLFIMQKIKNPVWIVPDSIMQYRKEHGDPVPKIVQSGPNNPLGYFAMRLSKPTFLIHGTNEPDSVGRRSSAGCIHLFGKDIANLFSMVPVKTKVHIVNEPYLLTKQNDTFYFASFKPLVEMQQQFVADPTLQQQTLQQAVASVVPKQLVAADMQQLQPMLKAATGVVQKVDL